MSDNINFDNPTTTSSEGPTPWARAAEFDGEGKQIQFLDWNVLKVGEGSPPVKYVNNEGYTYRLTFSEGVGRNRFIENKYDSFMTGIRKVGTIKKNSWGILRRRKEGETWVWTFTLIAPMVDDTGTTGDPPPPQPEYTAQVNPGAEEIDFGQPEPSE